MSRRFSLGMVGIGGLLLALVAVAELTVNAALLSQVRARYGEVAAGHLQRLGDVMVEVQSSSDLARLKAINAFFNAFAFRADSQQWGVIDYWATPFELMAKEGGDCEDFAIAKYFALRALGIGDEHLRLMYVRARNGELNQAHMVLAYYPVTDAEPLVLDNLRPEILPASMRGDLQPVYSFNGQGLWQAKARGLGQSVASGGGSVPQWQALTERIERGD
jgi:predicted transglutaminase-like cysteine proteinase